MKRSELVDVLKRVGCAVAPKPVAPALGAVFFDNDFAKTFDGELAAFTPCPLIAGGGVDFKLLKTWLGGASGDEVESKFSRKENSVVFTCGRSTLKLPVLGKAEFMFEDPAIGAVRLTESSELPEMFKKVVAFAGEDAAHPSRMGVTISVGGGFVSAFASDNVSFGTASASVEGSGDIASQLPTRFVRSFLALSGDSPISEVELDEGFAHVSFEDDTELFGRVGSEVNVAGYEGVLNGFLKKVDHWFPVPVCLIPLLTQAKKMLGVAGGDLVQLDVSSGALTATVDAGARGKFCDAVEVDDGGECASIKILCRETLMCADGALEMAFQEGGLVFRGPDFTHLVAAVVGS